MFGVTIRQLFLNYPDQIRDSEQWWQFLAKWTIQLGDTSILCQMVMAHLYTMVVESCLLAVFKHVGHPLARVRIFGISYLQGGNGK